MAAGRVKVLVVGVCIAALVLAAYYFGFVIPRGELGLKKQYATLQSLELAHRDDTPPYEPLVLENALGTSYSALGVPTGDPKTPRAWLILNEATPQGSLFAVPEGASLRLSCSYVTQLEQTVKIDATVLKHLRGECANGP